MTTPPDPAPTGPAPAALPPLPAWLGSPQVVIYIGMPLWLIATIVVGVTGIGSTTTFVSCLIGLGVGLFGTTIFLVQRRASRRGDRSAQQGLS